MQVHTIVLSSLRSAKQLYRFYGETDGPADYSAIVCVKREERFLDDHHQTTQVIKTVPLVCKVVYNKHSGNHLQTVWKLSNWSVDHAALLRVYEAIGDVVDWTKDAVLAYDRGHQPHPEVLRFFQQGGDRVLAQPIYSFNRFYANEQDAQLYVDTYKQAAIIHLKKVI